MQLENISDKVEDSGVNNEYKEKLELYLDRIANHLLVICNNIALIQCLVELDMSEDSVLIKKVPYLTSNLHNNAWIAIIMQLCALLKDTSYKKHNNTPLNLHELLNFIEKHESDLFTEGLLEARVPEGTHIDSYHEILTRDEHPQTASVVLECRRLLESIEPEILAISIVRDKVYAHLDKAYLNTSIRSEIFQKIGIERIESVYRVAFEVFNRVNFLYNRQLIQISTHEISKDVFHLESLLSKING